MWVNISQAAKLTGYKYGEIRRLIAKGAFPFYHNGRKSFKFELEDLKTAIRSKSSIVVPATAWSRRHSNGVRDGRTSLWTPRTPRFGTSCDRSRSSGNH